MPWSDTINLLREKGVPFAEGLNCGELDSAEEYFGICFPDDYRELLHEALPVGERFPDWRRRPDSIRRSLDWPWDGMAFDIKQNSWWSESWGSKPPSLDDSLRIAKHHFDQAPTLIPVYGHRYIPSEPVAGGNPIYSVHQMDIIYYGATLKEYLEVEFLDGARSTISNSFRPIRFWSDVVE